MKRSQLRADPDKVRAFNQRGRGKLKRSPIKRTIPSPRRGVKYRTVSPVAAANDFSSKTRALVRARSGGVCEAAIVGVCMGRAGQMHHRKLRRHGDHRPVNALHVCQSCHDYIHLHPKWARTLGLLLRSSADPDAVPPVRGARPAA